jgi:hypothetical protein
MDCARSERVLIIQCTLLKDYARVTGRRYFLKWQRFRGRRFVLVPLIPSPFLGEESTTLRERGGLVEDRQGSAIQGRLRGLTLLVSRIRVLHQGKGQMNV